MRGSIYRVGQFKIGVFAQIMIGVYSLEAYDIVIELLSSFMWYTSLISRNDFMVMKDLSILTGFCMQSQPHGPGYRCSLLS